MRLTFFIFLLLFTKNCSNTEKQSLNNIETIEEAVYNILTLCKTDKINDLNKKYINPNIGIYEKKKIGLMAEFFHTHEIEKITSSTGTIYQILTNLDKIDINQKLVFYDNLKYNCENLEWNKSGLIASKNFNINKSRKKLKLDSSNLIEKNSNMIVLTNSNIVFYLTKLKGRFYITMIDRMITDCSA
jgi:hypothetical protein